MDPADRIAILDLISRYSYGYDTQDWELFASIWADDAVLVNGDEETWSATRIVAAGRKRREMLAAEHIQTRHSQTNTLLEEQGGRVTGRTILTSGGSSATRAKRKGSVRLSGIPWCARIASGWGPMRRWKLFSSTGQPNGLRLR